MKRRKTIIGGLGLIVLLAVVLTSCGSPAVEQSHATLIALPPATDLVHGFPALPESGPLPPVHYDRANSYSIGATLVPDKQVYQPGETVHFTLTVTNGSTGNVTNPIEVGPLPPKVGLYKGRDREHFIKTFPAGTETKALNTGENVTYEFDWDQRDDNGAQIASGWIGDDILVGFKVAGSTTQSGGGGPVLLIQPPQGSMNKTIQVNQSQTIPDYVLFNADNGTQVSVNLVLTLKSLELTDNTIRFFVLETSPDNPMRDYKNWAIMGAQAQYAIDGVFNSTVYWSNTQAADDGIELKWGYDDAGTLDPVPVGAKVLTIILTQIGERETHLEFQVPLE